MGTAHGVKRLQGFEVKSAQESIVCLSVLIDMSAGCTCMFLCPAVRKVFFFFFVLILIFCLTEIEAPIYFTHVPLYEGLCFTSR